MSGPLRSLSDLIHETINQTAEVNQIVERLRAANRNLTGGTGQPPTPIGKAEQGGMKPDEPSLMVRLTIALEALNGATGELRNEMAYLEQLSETAAQSAEPKTAYA